MACNRQHPYRQQRKRQFQLRIHIICHTALLLLLFSNSLDCSIGASDGSEPVCTATAASDCSTHNNGDDDNNSNNHIFAARHLDHGVLEWIASQPGVYYNPKQYMDEREGLVGIFATAPIAKGELLCRIPWEWTFHGEILESSQLSCSLVKHLQRHFQLGESSKYAPYIQYLKNQPNHQLVSAWSKAGQDLILRILGQTREENNDPQAYGEHPHSLALHMPPELLTNWLDGEYRKFCKGDEAGYKAALLALMRADDSIMIPGYDFVRNACLWCMFVTMGGGCITDNGIADLLCFLDIHLLLSTIIEMDFGTMPIRKFYGRRPMKVGQHETFKRENKSSSATIDAPIVSNDVTGMGRQVRLFHGGKH